MKWITDQNQQLLRMKRNKLDAKNLLEEMYVKEQSLKQNCDPSRLMSKRDAHSELMSMFLKKQLQNELECRLANRSKNKAIQDVLPDGPSSSSHKSENKLDKPHDICEKKAEELRSVNFNEKTELYRPVAALKWEELPELYIQEEDDETIKRSALEAVSKKEVQLAV